METKDLPKYAQKALARLNGGFYLVRTSSSTEEAAAKGGGYLYTMEPGGKPFPTKSASILIESGALVPREDGLMPGMSQTFSIDAD